MEKTKTCTGCGAEKTLTNFNYRKTNKGRACLRMICKACELLRWGKHNH